MIDCPQCGHANDAAADFCRFCNFYLGWAKEASPEPPSPPPVTRGPASPPLPPAPKPAPAPLPPDQRTLLPPPPAPEAPPAGTPAAGEVSAPTAPAAGVDVDAPAADLACRRCGATSPPTRRFCTRCGGPLVDPPAAVRSRSVGKARPGSPLVAAAGDTAPPWGRRGWATMTRSGRAVLVTVVGVALALGLGPFRRDLAPGSLRTRLFPRPVYVPPGLQQGPAGLVDGAAEQVWRAVEPAAVAVVTFTTPVDLFKVGILPGQSGADAEFRSSPRPRQIRLVAQTQDGRTVTTTRELADTPVFQSFTLSARDATTVEVRIESTYGDPVEGDFGSVRELKFFRRG